MDDLTPDQLEAILGTDYETVLADILRRKSKAEDRQQTNNPVGQVGDGNVFFDPAGVLSNVMERRRATKDMGAAQAEMDKTLAAQKAGRRTFAEALGGKPAPAPMAPRSVDSAIPGQIPTQAPAPIPGAPQMAPGAPPALANASTMDPARLQRAGVPAHVQALLAKLRGQ